MSNTFFEVDRYFIKTFVGPDKVLENVLVNNQKHNLPAYDVSPSEGKLLYLLTKMNKAKRILEIGTLGGYSTIWFARALPDDGVIYSLEFNENHATVARENIKNAGFSHCTKVIVGAATDSMKQLITDQIEPFDLIFIDADKQNNPHYLELSLKLSKPGTVIIGDNVVRGGDVINNETTNEGTIGVRKFNEQLAKTPNVESIGFQTVGIKGHDGITLSIVTE